MRIKVYGGTQFSHGDSLCQTCRHARITRGRKLDEELIVCNQSHTATILITFRVTSCSGYSDERVPTYYELMQQAWVLQPENSKRGAGFVRASDLRDREVAAYIESMEDDDDDES